MRLVFNIFIFSFIKQTSLTVTFILIDACISQINFLLLFQFLSLSHRQCEILYGTVSALSVLTAAAEPKL